MFTIIDKNVLKEEIFADEADSFVRFITLSAFSGYNVGCKHSLHLENGL